MPNQIMRLLDTRNLEVKEFMDDEAPRYAILSHTWGEEEVTFQDMEGTHAANKKGFEKVNRCCSVARANGFKYVWVDTCCIDKTSSAELSEAINSMYRWYQEADVCYSFLADVPSKATFSGSRWFTRGWTLQELIAPAVIIFFDEEWKELGTKASLQQDVFNCTGIPGGILSGDDDLETFSIAQRMSWAAKRKTSRIEDRAYCLLGIFGINMPLIYGERETAFIRLQEEIMRISDDHSLFAWKSPDDRGGLLATSPAAFTGSDSIVQFNPFDTFTSPSTVSSRGVHLDLHFIGIGPHGLGLVILHCRERSGEEKPIAIYVRDVFLTMERFERALTGQFEILDLRKLRPSQYPMRRICIRKGRMTHMRQSKNLIKCDSSTLEEIDLDDTLTMLMDFRERTALLRAAERGFEDHTWLLLTRSDVEANLQDKDGWTALSHAVRGKSEVVVKMLLAQNNIKADLEDNNGRTPLSWAAEKGHKAVVRLLLNRGANAELKDNNGWTPLSWAAKSGHEAIVQLFLDRGANIESTDQTGRTPLSCATENGQEAVLRLLLDRGANIESTDQIGWTPLSWAAWSGHEAIVQLFLDRGANIESTDQTGRTPLLCATENGQEAVLRLLLDRGVSIELTDQIGQALLLCAARSGHETVVQLFLDRGANIESTDQTGRTPLLCATENGQEAVVRLLLDRGVNIESTDIYGRTPLLCAVENKQEDIVRLLIDRGASIDSTDRIGRTPLLCAAKNGQEAVVRLLLDRGVNIETANSYGWTPLLCAVEIKQEDIVRLLIERGAHNKLEDQARRSPLSWTIGQDIPDPLDLKPDDIVIAVMGITGCGKTTFVNLFSDYQLAVGHGLKSCTEIIQVVPCTLRSGKRIYLVDTPGFDDTYRSDADILREIANWLNTAYEFRIKLTGIIYLHGIFDVRFGGGGIKNIRMFKKLCGENGPASVVLAITMWEFIPEEVKKSRKSEIQQQSVYWKQMMDHGSKVFSQDEGRTSAMRIIQYLISRQQPVVPNI